MSSVFNTQEQGSARGQDTLSIAFLSPARRGSGILVAPGFPHVQASGVTFFVNVKTQKLVVNFFEILTLHS